MSSRYWNLGAEEAGESNHPVMPDCWINTVSVSEQYNLMSEPPVTDRLSGG